MDARAGSSASRTRSRTSFASSTSAIPGWPLTSAAAPHRFPVRLPCGLAYRGRRTACRDRRRSCSPKARSRSARRRLHEHAAVRRRHGLRRAQRPRSSRGSTRRSAASRSSAITITPTERPRLPKPLPHRSAQRHRWTAARSGVYKPEADEADDPSRCADAQAYAGGAQSRARQASAYVELGMSWKAEVLESPAGSETVAISTRANSSRTCGREASGPRARWCRSCSAFIRRARWSMSVAASAAG